MFKIWYVYQFCGVFCSGIHMYWIPVTYKEHIIDTREESSFTNIVCASHFRLQVVSIIGNPNRIFFHYRLKGAWQVFIENSRHTQTGKKCGWVEEAWKVRGIKYKRENKWKTQSIFEIVQHPVVRRWHSWRFVSVATRPDHLNILIESRSFHRKFTSHC